MRFAHWFRSRWRLGSLVTCKAARLIRASLALCLRLSQLRVESRKNAGTGYEFDHPRKPSSGIVPRLMDQPQS
jgi:hypothetical protein